MDTATFFLKLSLKGLERKGTPHLNAAQRCGILWSGVGNRSHRDNMTHFRYIHTPLPELLRTDKYNADLQEECYIFNTPNKRKHRIESSENIFRPPGCPYVPR